MKLPKHCLGALLMLLGAALWSAPASAMVFQGTFAIRNVKTGLLLRIQDAQPADGTPLVAYTPIVLAEKAATPLQLWPSVSNTRPCEETVASLALSAPNFSLC